MSQDKMNSEATEKKQSLKRFPYQLRRERKLRGWSQATLAELLGSSQINVSRWEKGEQLPGPYYRQKLAELFEKSLQELGLILEDTSNIDLVPDSKTKSIWNIPTSFTSFIGRAQEIAAICTLLQRADVRLLTLLGPGGIGKTRLSVQIAQVMRDFFADGACFVSLAALRDPALVIPTIASMLGIQESGTSPIADLVKMALRGRHLLLLLDNFEQVIAEAPRVEELLSACPNLKILVTSRTVLHLSTEQEFPLPPLELPILDPLPESHELLHFAAVDLFVQRAQAILPAFQITSDNARAIGEICVRLDGLPLAIELAAARSKLLPPQTLLAKLSSSLHLLKNHLRTVPARHLTLYSTIQWSYDLLDEQEKWLFCHLSVFSGGGTLEAIEFLVAQSQQQTIDVLNILSSLIDNSLLQQVDRSGEPRFIMLETVRDYGLDCLQQQGELEVYQRIHAQFYASFVADAGSYLTGAQQAEWLLRLEQEMENLRAALGWLIEHRETKTALHFCDAFGKFCGLRGYWSEERRWLQSVLELPHHPDAQAIRARVSRRAGHLAYRLRDLTAARAWYEESAAHSREVGDKQNLAGVLSGLAWTLYRRGDATSAAHLLEESVVVARELGDLWSLANTLESLGRFMYTQGNTDEALLLVEESVALTRKLAARHSLARILTTLVSIEMASGNITRAEALARESFAIAQELGTRPLKAVVLESLGVVALFQGKYKQAAHLFEERITLARELDDIPAIAKNQLLLGDIALVQGDFEYAGKLVQDALAFFREQGDNPNVALSLNILGAIRLAQGAFREARQHYREALALDNEGGNKRGIGRHLIGLAIVALNQEQPEDAARLFSAAASWIKPDVDMHPAQRETYGHAIKQLRTQLGDIRFEDAWFSGTEMEPKQALER